MRLPCVRSPKRVRTNPAPPLAQSDGWAVRKEALGAICNALVTGTPEQIRYIVQQGCLEPLCELLQVAEVDPILGVLRALDAVLQVRGSA